jgi:hypothetical protein
MRLGRLAFLSLVAAEAVAAAAQVTEPQRAESPEIAAEFSTGVEYQQGDYSGEETVETQSVQTAVHLRAGRATFSAALPFHRIDAPANVVGGGGGLLGLPIIIDPTQPATRTRREGIGDLRVGAAYALPPVTGFDISIQSQVKLPTAQAGLGTGEADLSVGGEVSRTIGMVTPFVSFAYTVPGRPESFDLRNSMSARAGLALQLSRGLRGNVSFAYAGSVSPSIADEQQVSTSLNAAISRTLSLGIYGSAGLSEGSPDVGAGLSLGFRLF